MRLLEDARELRAELLAQRQQYARGLAMGHDEIIESQIRRQMRRLQPLIENLDDDIRFLESITQETSTRQGGWPRDGRLSGVLDDGWSKMNDVRQTLRAFLDPDFTIGHGVLESQRFRFRVRGTEGGLYDGFSTRLSVPQQDIDDFESVRYICDELRRLAREWKEGQGEQQPVGD